MARITFTNRQIFPWLAWRQRDVSGTWLVSLSVGKIKGEAGDLRIFFFLHLLLQSGSDTQTFVSPRVNTKTFGERSFSYAGPSLWNNLPPPF